MSDAPAASVPTVQVSVTEFSRRLYAPCQWSRSGLVMLSKPWLARVSATATFKASDGPLFLTTIV